MDLQVPPNQRAPAQEGTPLQRQPVKLRLADQLLKVLLLLDITAGDGINARHPGRLGGTVALDKLRAVPARLWRLAKAVGRVVHVEAGVAGERIVLIRH